MKRILTAIFIGLFTVSCFGQKSTLTKTEIELLRKIEFKADIISELKDLTRSELHHLPAIDEETGDVLQDRYYRGIYAEATEAHAVEFVKKLKTKFRAHGYLIFVFEGEYGKKSVAVIKGQDELDILRYRRTDGINYDLNNEDVVKKVSQWNSAFGIQVIGCSRDWLYLEFDKLPKDIAAFAKEVYEFCPDTVDQGVGTMEKLKEVIVEMKGVWLWWD